MIHNDTPNGSHDNLGVTDLQRSEEAQALHSDVYGGPLDERAANSSFDHLGRSLPDQDRLDVNSVKTEQGYEPIIPGATVVYGGIAKLRARRSQAAVDKARAKAQQ